MTLTTFSSLSLYRSNMQKAVLILSIRDERVRKKVLVTTSGFPGIKSVEIDDKNERLTVIGNIDVSVIAIKLRKICKSCIIDTVEPVKEPGAKPKPGPPKPDVAPVPVIPLGYPFNYYPSSYGSCYYHPPYANAKIVEEEPKICVIL
ncbi:PREDICTED: uncharacterized protein LOC104825116 [Tarenaya hassleriana]|uniref:uncharacterized protein LOC104825116 n=1 Tax=Tarenaya hassleriana TaxID=28532 RepID=UPI00053C7860|nr:PREDICTED: uncharacterized protein LOC104825116 [Tarenaya hassleriana]